MERVLVAEDSMALANLLEFVLGNAGFEVTVHRSGLAARDAAANEQFDAILLDQQMPEMTGLEVIEQLRKSGPNMSTPIFLCTSKTHELDIASLQEELGITRVFHKPFSPLDLVSNLRTHTTTASERV